MLFTGSKAVSMCSLAYLVFMSTLHVFSLTRLFPCLWISLFSLLAFGHWQGFQPGAGFPWRKPEQEKDESGIQPDAHSQGDSSRTLPHVGLVTVPLQGCISALQDKAASLLWAAGTRTAWGCPAKDGQMVFLAHGSEWLHGSPLLLPCTTTMKNMSFP